MRKALFFITFIVGSSVFAQEPAIQTKQDSTSTGEDVILSPFNTGFLPIGFFDLDLKYIVKYNNYEGLRLGFGGVTNNRLFESFKISG